MPRRSTANVLRLGVAVVALLLGATLVFTAWAQWRGLDEEAHRLEQDPGEDLLRALREDLGSTASGPEDPAPAASLLARWHHAGLRHLALVQPDGTVVLSAGEALHTADGVLPPGAAWSVSGERVWMVEAPQPPASPSPAGGGPRDPELQRSQSQRPRLVIEYVPERAVALQRTARRGLLLAFWVAGTLLAGAGAVWVYSRRAEEAAAREAAQEQLAALGRMSAVLAHELRNPLTSLKGHAQLLEEYLPEGRSQKKAARVVGEAERMEALITDLLDFVRAGRLETEPAELDTVVGDAARAAEGAVLVDQDTPVSVSGAAGTVQLDRERVRQVVINLVENGLQHGPPVNISISREGPWAVVRVDDHGPGVPLDQREQVFAPFHTTRTRGTGLGLAVARQIAQSHGGSLHCEEGPKGGARFVLRLPVRSQES